MEIRKNYNEHALEDLSRQITSHLCLKGDAIHTAHCINNPTVICTADVKYKSCATLQKKRH